MKGGSIAAVLAGAALLAFSVVFVKSEVGAAEKRLTEPPKKDAPTAAIADNTEAPYCTPGFKGVLQRVLNACGLVGQEARRGCQPADVKTFASISDEDFNALFNPLAERGAIIMFDDNSEKLDDSGKKLLLERWEDRRGARYFFIVARASRTGGAEANRALSHKRANSVMFFLQETTKDPELDKQVGMLWLGSEFAQLPKEYCDTWTNSRQGDAPKPDGAGATPRVPAKGKACTTDAVNRSAFVSWVDCRL